MGGILLSLAVALACAPSTGSGDTGEINASPECEDFCDLKLTCDPDKDPADPVDRDTCLLECTAEFYNAASIDQQVCPLLLQQTYLCVNALDTCTEFQSWFDRTPSDYACKSPETEYCLQCGCV